MIKEIKFLGIGNAFNYQEDCNSCYFVKDRTMYFIDMGEKIAAKIITLNLVKDVDNIVIIITHMHADHVGSLTTLLDYLKYIVNINNIKIIYPNKIKLVEYLHLTHFKNADDIEIDTNKDIDINGLNIKAIPQIHVDDSYGYLINDGKEIIYYSGDASKINEDAFKMFMDGKIDYFYHDVSMVANKYHVGINEFIERVPKNLRKKICFMHFNDDEIIRKAIDNGFSVAKDILE